MSFMKRALLVALLAAVPAVAQKYAGPEPPQSDLPYLVHASTLIPTEALTAQQDEKKDEITYTINGAASSARTPLAEPIFLMKSSKIAPDRLSLYRMDVKNGRREVTFNQRKPKDNQRPVALSVHRLDQGLYRIEANETMTNGQYCLSPDGSNQVFCFEVY